jgi:hypothetical protein
MEVISDSTVACTAIFSTPVFSVISEIKSAFVIVKIRISPFIGLQI